MHWSKPSGFAIFMLFLGMSQLVVRLVLPPPNAMADIVLGIGCVCIGVAIGEQVANE